MDILLSRIADGRTVDAALAQLLGHIGKFVCGVCKSRKSPARSTNHSLPLLFAFQTAVTNLYYEP